MLYCLEIAVVQNVLGLVPPILQCPVQPLPRCDRFWLALHLAAALLLPTTDVERIGKQQEKQVGRQCSWSVRNRATFLAEGQYHDAVTPPRYSAWSIWKHCLVLLTFVGVLADFITENKRGGESKCCGQRRQAFYFTAASSGNPGPLFL